MDSAESQPPQLLLPEVYEDLRRLAASRLRHEKPGQTLQATALVHEAYLRVAKSSAEGIAPQFENRHHFFAAELLKLRYFVGFTIEEAADVLDMSPARLGVSGPSRKPGWPAN